MLAWFLMSSLRFLSRSIPGVTRQRHERHFDQMDLSLKTPQNQSQCCFLRWKTLLQNRICEHLCNNLRTPSRIPGLSFPLSGCTILYSVFLAAWILRFWGFITLLRGRVTRAMGHARVQVIAWPPIGGLKHPELGCRAGYGVPMTIPNGYESPRFSVFLLVRSKTLKAGHGWRGSILYSWCGCYSDVHSI